MERRQIFRETFVSPFGQNTKEQALRVLDDIRKAHDEDHGWLEIKGYVEKRADGKWYAVREHAKFR